MRFRLFLTDVFQSSDFAEHNTFLAEHRTGLLSELRQIQVQIIFVLVEIASARRISEGLSLPENTSDARI